LRASPPRLEKTSSENGGSLAQNPPPNRYSRGKARPVHRRIANYSFSDSRYGIPLDPAEEDPEVADLLLRRHNYRVSAGLKNVGGLDGIQARMNYSDYNHQEIVGGEPETTLFNKQFIYRTVFDQKRRGRLGGSFGFWGIHRDYKTIGEESLAPPTTHNAFAAFALESLDFESLRLQFGGCVEHNQFNPTGLRERSFTGFSGAAGLSRRSGKTARSW
jgi:iron complex outermembrane receptor protein